jgi:hypothetical protein
MPPAKVLQGQGPSKPQTRVDGPSKPQTLFVSVTLPMPATAGAPSSAPAAASALRRSSCPSAGQSRCSPGAHEDPAAQADRHAKYSARTFGSQISHESAKGINWKAVPAIHTQSLDLFCSRLFVVLLPSQKSTCNPMTKWTVPIRCGSLQVGASRV